MNAIAAIGAAMAASNTPEENFILLSFLLLRFKVMKLIEFLTV